MKWKPLTVKISNLLKIVLFYIKNVKIRNKDDEKYKALPKKKTKFSSLS